MTRAAALAVLKTAGYHEDRKTWTRVYVENRVSYKVAMDQWALGQKAKAAGVRCTCRDCNP